MNRTFLKVALRVIGSLSGVAGVAMLIFIPISLSRTDAPVVIVALSLLSLLFAGYLVYVSFLVWFKLSPLAVRHICGLLGFYAFMRVMRLFDDLHDSMWASIAFGVCLFAVYFSYKAASRWLSLQLFPDPGPDVQA